VFVLPVLSDFRKSSLMYMLCTCKQSDFVDFVQILKNQL